MAREEFTVRITKSGEIFVEMEGLPPRRIKDIVKYLEETVGPARFIESEDGGASGNVELDDRLGREEAEDQEETKQRLRIRDGEK